MKIDCALLPRLIKQRQLAGQIAVVVDVMRASTVMVTALESGSPWIAPVTSRSEAYNMLTRYAAENPLLAGERLGVKISGFDLGNSPFEFTSEAVAGRPLIMTTTNGTSAILRARKARRVVIGAFINLSAIVNTINNCEELLLVCSGTRGIISLEDTACNGAIIERLINSGKSVILSDAATIAYQVYLQYKENLVDMMKTKSEHGKKLIKLGFEKDIEFAATIDRSHIVPALKFPGCFIRPLNQHKESINSNNERNSNPIVIEEHDYQKR